MYNDSLSLTAHSNLETAMKITVTRVFSLLRRLVAILYSVPMEVFKRDIQQKLCR